MWGSYTCQRGMWKAEDSFCESVLASCLAFLVFAAALFTPY